MKGYRAYLEGTDSDPCARPAIFRVATWKIDRDFALEQGRVLNQMHHDGAFLIHVEEAEVVAYTIQFRSEGGMLQQTQIYVPLGGDPEMEASHHAHMEKLEERR